VSLINEITSWVHDLFGNQTLRTTETSSIFGDIRIPISLGLVEGVKIFKISGLNDDIDNNDREDIISQGGTYQWLLSADTLNISSTSADDSAAGIGAQKITVIGLAPDFSEQTKEYILNGITVVTTADTWLRINNVIVSSVGANEFNVGEISINGTTLGNTLAHIPLDTSDIGLNKSFQTIFTVPLGFVALPIEVIPSITKRGGGTGVREGAFTIMVRNIISNVFLAGSLIAARSDGSGVNLVNPNYPSVLDEKTDVKGVAIAYSNNTRMVMNVSFLLIEKSVFGLV